MVRKLLFVGAVLQATVSVAVAQNAKPTYEGDPSVYKLIFEDANFRVIKGTRKAGVHDKTHAHLSLGVVYNLTDCKTKIYEADGKTREAGGKAGTATPVPVIPSHSAEEIGTNDCEQLFVERK
jgi:hypothetical protein